MNFNGAITDSIRALAGVLASENIDEEVKDKAKATIMKLIDAIDKSAELEFKALTEISAKMNGIIS